MPCWRLWDCDCARCTSATWRRLTPRQSYTWPKFAKISDRYGGVKFYAVDVDAAKPVAQKHAVSSMPTFVFFQGGKEIDRFSGADENKLSQLIERYK